MEHLAGKRTGEISVGKLFADFGLDKLNGHFRSPDAPLVFEDAERWETAIQFTIDLIADLIAGLATILLECKVSESVDLRELSGSAQASVPSIRLTAAPVEHALIDRALADFAANPRTYDLSEMCPEEEILEMAALCGKLRAELYR